MAAGTARAVSEVHDHLTRWTTAGVIDEATAARIAEFERDHVSSGRLRWPILVALAFGGLLIASGVLLFVSAHWDSLSPGSRFALVLTLVAIFHVAAAIVADRFPAMSSALHAIGTVALGAGIFLAGQIFNLDEHWPGGLMLWAFGAAIAWALLGQTAQFALLAILLPAWLTGEWIVAFDRYMAHPDSERVVACGLFLLALAYFTAVTDRQRDPRRWSLLWIGGIALLPSAAFLAATSGWPVPPAAVARQPAFAVRTIGWILALGLPMLTAFVFRRQDAWMNACALVWVLMLIVLRAFANSLALYGWWAIGAIGLVAWGVAEARRERINMGTAIFAATVIAFYFSQVMDKLGRSASLVGLGILFLAGGWALERVRRRLIFRVRGQA